MINIVKKLSDNRKDFRGILFSKIRSIMENYLRIYSTSITYFKARIMGITIGQGCKFYGTPSLIRFHRSKINMGNNCRFRSDRKTNLIGINRKCIISTLRVDAEIDIGNNVGLSGTVISAAKKIRIGNDVLCGANVTITDTDWHPVDPLNRHSRVGINSLPVNINDNVWLGLNVVVLKGVTIGKNSIIGPNSVVIKDIPANVIAAGNPCKVIKEL